MWRTLEGGCCPEQERPWRPKSLGLSLDTQGSLFPSRTWLRWKITQNKDGQAPGDLQAISISQVVLLRDPWGLAPQVNFCGGTAPCILMPRPHPPPQVGAKHPEGLGNLGSSLKFPTALPREGRGCCVKPEDQFLKSQETGLGFHLLAVNILLHLSGVCKMRTLLPAVTLQSLLESRSRHTCLLVL